MQSEAVYLRYMNEYKETKVKSSKSNVALYVIAFLMFVAYLMLFTFGYGASIGINKFVLLCIGLVCAYAIGQNALSLFSSLNEYTEAVQEYVDYSNKDIGSKK